MKDLPPPSEYNGPALRPTYPEREPVRAQYAEAPEPDREAVHGGILGYWRMLRRNKGAMVFTVFAGALAGFLFTLPQTPIYQAHTTIEIQTLNDNFLNMRDVNPTTSDNLYDPEYDIQTQMSILQNRFLVERVVQKLKKENEPLTVDEGRLGRWRAALGLAAANPEALRQEAIASAAGNLKVTNQINTRLLELTCDSTSPQFAADFLNTLSHEFIEQNLEARWQTTEHTGQWLQKQMEDLKIKLEKSDDELQNYARSTGLLFTNEKDNVDDQKLKQLQGELGSARADRINKQSRYELALKTPPDSLPSVLDDSSLRVYATQLTELRRQLADLSSTFTPNHPKVQRIQAQIATVEASLERERGNNVKRIRNDFEAANRREKLLDADYGSQARLISEQSDKVSHYNILKREVDTDRQLYDSMLQRVKEAGIAAALRASNISVVDPATPPPSPYKPNIKHNTALGMLFGLFAGIAFVFIRERADRSIQEPGETESYINLPELGVIPAAETDPYRKRPLIAGIPGMRGDIEDHSLALSVTQRKPSVITECFRSLLASILFCGRKGEHPRVLVLSSANPREGKTTVASNLAIALAEVNQRVVLIDGDLRRPCMHDIFNLENDIGLTDILRYPKPLNGDSLSAFIQQTTVPNLSVITSGRGGLVPNLVYSNRFPELVGRLRQEFDMVLIDTPPMLQMSDARVMGRHADAVLLVLRAHSTTRDAAILASRRFAEDGTRVLGTVLNDWNPANSASYGYTRYYEHYHRYYGTKTE
jgi:capsular exopolysaccharide synthesis family protein